MTVTQFQDVELAYKRPIPSEDQTWIEDQIAQAEAILEDRRGDLDDWITAGADQTKRHNRVVMVVCRMVIRVLKNPDGFYTESDGDYSYGRDKSIASGEIYASAADLRLIGIRLRRTPSSFRLYLPADSPRNMNGHC